LQGPISLTICTNSRSEVFTHRAIVSEMLEQIARAAAARGFAVITYCFMPDHVHLLVAGTADNSDLIAFADLVKQLTEHRYRRARRCSLWQKGYYEHVLRNDESTLAVARYILENPVRAGLVTNPRDYEFSGSLTLTREQLDELWQVDHTSLGTP